MCSAVIIILLAAAQVQELAATHTPGMQDSVNELVEEMVNAFIDKAQKLWHLHHVQMDDTTLAKARRVDISIGTEHLSQLVDSTASQGSRFLWRSQSKEKIALRMPGPARSISNYQPRRVFLAAGVALVPMWAWRSNAMEDAGVRLLDVKNPKTPAAFAAAERGDFTLAETLFSQTLLDDPNRCRTDVAQVCSRTFSNMGSAQLSLGKKYEALFSFTRAIALAPGSPELRLNQARVHHALNELEAAAEDCAYAIELDPKESKAWNYRGEIEAQMGDWQKAVEDFRKSADLDPASVGCKLQQALAEWQIGNVEIASQLLSAVEHQDSNYAEAQAALSLVLWSLGKTQDAKNLFAVAQRLDPSLQNPTYATRHKWSPIARDTFFEFVTFFALVALE